MRPLCHLLSRCVRPAGLSVALILAGCTGQPRVMQSPVPEEVIKRLKVAPTALGGRSGKAGIAVLPSSVAEGPVQVPMRSLYGLPCVLARINGGSPVPLMVDTGSEVNVLEARTALARDVQIIPQSRVSTTITGALGSERVLVGIPDQLDIGTWRLRNIPCVVRTNENHLILAPWDRRDIGFNVLGMDLLVHACGYVTLDYAAGQIVFGVGSTFLPPSRSKHVWSAPLSIRRGIAYVTLHNDGHSWMAMVDTGYNGFIEIEEKTAARLHLLDDAVESKMTRVGVGTPSPGQEAPLRAVMLPGFTSLGPQMINIPTAIVPDRSKIGSGLLRPFRVTLDFKRGLLWLEARSRDN